MQVSKNIKTALDMIEAADKKREEILAESV
jgi:hypothetical protein